MSLTQFALMLNRLDNAAGSNEKQSILRGFLAKDDGKIAFLLEQAVSSLVTFGVKQLPTFIEAIDKFDEDEAWDNLNRVMTALSKRELTGGDAQSAIAMMFGRMRPDHREAARRILIKDLRCGVTAKAINKAKPDTVFEWCPQLAPSTYADPNKLDYPVWVEIKHDGYRATKAHGCNRYDGLRSREGLVFENFHEVEDMFNSFAPKDFTFDMEIMCPLGFSELKKRAGGTSDASIYAVLFDVLPLGQWKTKTCVEEFHARRRRVEYLVKKINHPLLKLSEGRIAHNAEEVLAFYDYARSLGCEGIMVKDMNGRYEYTRSAAWQKMKPSKTIDLKVKDFKEGDRNTKNAGTLGAYYAEGTIDHEGQDIFVSTWVGSGFKPDKLVRDDIWNHQDKYRGMTAEISFMELSKDQDGNWSLRHPSHKRFRTDK